MSADDPFAAPRVSVCMATYNGEEFIGQQVSSILRQLGPDDELVVADDASTDRTVARLREFDDARIRILRSSVNLGHVRAFERAMADARGSVVFLADQDDVWTDGRVSAMCAALRGYPVVAGSLGLLGDPHARFGVLRSADSGARTRNLVGIMTGRRAYFGSAMGYRSELAPALLPIPSTVQAHDHWIAITGCLAGGIGHLDQAVVYRRVHDQNLTPRSRRRLGAVVWTRILMVLQLGEAIRRAHHTR